MVFITALWILLFILIKYSSLSHLVFCLKFYFAWYLYHHFFFLLFEKENFLHPGKSQLDIFLYFVSSSPFLSSYANSFFTWLEYIPSNIFRKDIFGIHPKSLCISICTWMIVWLHTEFYSQVFFTLYKQCFLSFMFQRRGPKYVWLPFIEVVGCLLRSHICKIFMLPLKLRNFTTFLVDWMHILTPIPPEISLKQA